MEKVVTENLFLLEFLVDTVALNNKAVPAESVKFCEETCVCFQFLDNAPLDICEADFLPRRDYDKDGGSLKSGKSCLFALTAAQANEASSHFDVHVGIFKKMADGILPEKLQVGAVLISISNLFNELIASMTSKKSQPAAKTLKDSFQITNADNVMVGNITVFIRMSCFGKLIVTQFQMNLEEKCVLFKDKEGNALYRYKKIGKSGAEGDNPVTGGRGGSAGGLGGNQGLEASCSCAAPEAQQVCGQRPQQQQQQPYCPAQGPPHGQLQPQYTCDVRPGGYGQEPYGHGSHGGFPGMGQDNDPLHNQCNQQCFQEIGAEMAGNALKIRVHRDPKTSVQRMTDGGGWQPQEGMPYCPAYGPGNPGGGPSPFMQQQAAGRYGYPPGYPQRAPPLPGAIMPCVPLNYPDNTSMNMRPENYSQNPVALKMAACPNAAADDNVTVIPPCPTGQEGLAQVMEIPDPTKDVFVLRIGKKTEGNDKKSNLELELQTPKGMDRKPPAKKETRETQCEETKDDKKGKGKGGKGKGGKGKGGKGKGGKGGKGKKKKK